MPHDVDLSHYVDWLQQAAQLDHFSIIGEIHVNPARIELGIEESDFESELPESIAIELGSYMFDNSFNYLAGDAMLGAIYLKKRGWKDSVANRAYIAAVMETPARLLQVRAVAGNSVTLACAFGEVPDETVTLDSSDPIVEEGDILAARIVTLRGRRCLAEGVLPFPEEEYDFVMGFLEDRRDGLLEISARDNLDLKIPAELPEFLAKFPQLAASAWLVFLLREGADDELAPPDFTYDGEPVEYWKFVYDIADGVSGDDVAAALNASPDFGARFPGVWSLIDPADVARPAPGTYLASSHAADASDKLASVMLRDDFVYCHTNSASRRTRLRDAMARCGEDLWRGPAIETPEKFRDVIADIKFHADHYGQSD